MEGRQGKRDAARGISFAGSLRGAMIRQARPPVTFSPMGCFSLIEGHDAGWQTKHFRAVQRLPLGSRRILWLSPCSPSRSSCQVSGALPLQIPLQQGLRGSGLIHESSYHPLKGVASLPPL